jgi:hypothetical protein
MYCKSLSNQSLTYHWVSPYEILFKSVNKWLLHLLSIEYTFNYLFRFRKNSIVFQHPFSYNIIY